MLFALEIYLEETDQWHGKPLYAALIELARDQGLMGATAYRGVMGFGASARIHSIHVLDVSENLPIVVKIIDQAAKVDSFAKTARSMSPGAKIATWPVTLVE